MRTRYFKTVYILYRFCNGGLEFYCVDKWSKSQTYASVEQGIIGINANGKKVNCLIPIGYKEARKIIPTAFQFKKSKFNYSSTEYKY